MQRTKLQSHRMLAPAARRKAAAILSDKPALDVVVEFVEASEITSREVDLVFSNLGQSIEELFR